MDFLSLKRGAQNCRTFRVNLEQYINSDVFGKKRATDIQKPVFNHKGTPTHSQNLVTCMAEI